MTKPADSHCHLDFDKFDKDRDKVIETARERLDYVVVAGCNPERNRKVKELCEESEFLVPNYGLHPTFQESFDSTERVKEQIKDWSPAAIGEVGLDHHHITSQNARNKQVEVFRDMLKLAEKLDIGVVVHSRDAEGKCYRIVKEYDVEVFFHCFNGSLGLARKITSSANYIGITTQILYSKRVQNLAESLDLSDLIIETDSPFLYPDGRNEPKNILEIVEKLSELKGVDSATVKQATTENSRKFFDLQ